VRGVTLEPDPPHGLPTSTPSSKPREGIMAPPIVVEFGQARTEKRSLSLSRADKDRILQNFPEKIAVAVQGFGNQEFPLRAQVKGFLDAIQPPTVKATFEVRGKPDDVASVTIDNTRIKVIGVYAGSFDILNASVAYQFDVDVESDGPTIEACTGDDGREGQRAERVFKLIWTIDIEIEPGVGGTFEIEEIEIPIEAPCCCPQEQAKPLAEPEAQEELREEEEHEEEETRGKKKAGKKKRKNRD
jgi:hypothetical protein